MPRTGSFLLVLARSGAADDELSEIGGVIGFLGFLELDLPRVGASGTPFRCGLLPTTARTSGYTLSSNGSKSPLISISGSSYCAREGISNVAVPANQNRLCLLHPSDRRKGRC